MPVGPPERPNHGRLDGVARRRGDRRVRAVPHGYRSSDGHSLTARAFPQDPHPSAESGRRLHRRRPGGHRRHGHRGRELERHQRQHHGHQHEQRQALRALQARLGHRQGQGHGHGAPGRLRHCRGDRDAGAGGVRDREPRLSERAGGPDGPAFRDDEGLDGRRADGTSEGQSGTAAIAVTTVPVAAVAVTPASAGIQVGQTVQLTATPQDGSGSPLSGRAVTWASSNGLVVTVSGSGLVTAAAVGSAIITATSEGQTGTSSITVTNVPVASVAVTPGSATIQVGQTQQLAATLKDASGNTLSGRAVSWTSSNPSVASVSGSGLVTGLAAGSAVITAMSEGKTGTATLTVVAPPPPPGAPGAVTDLAVAGATDTSVTLSFTEVSDGAGQPASYDVRFAVAPISWGSATAVARGTCATPLAGSAIGTKRTCTVLGLSASTAYGFQLIAFRGTLNVDAVFGSLSNVASATTAAGTPKPVASVSVSPGSASVAVGGTQQFTATLKDANGNVLSGRTVSWSSSAPLTATVSGTGLMTGLAAGTSTVSATSEGQGGTASLAVTADPPPPPAGTWPHEPSSAAVIGDQPFNTLTTSDGWSIVDNTNGWGSIVSDGTAPFSPTGVLQYLYPVGFTGGTGPAAEWHGLPGLSQVFVGLWWKVSNPWQGHASNVNKIAFLFPGSGGDMYIAMYGTPGGPYELKVIPQFPGLPSNWLEPNVAHVPVQLGTWHRIEWLINYNGGVVQWWLDGQLIGSYTGVPFPSGTMTEFKMSSTWGGIGDSKSETDYYWFDHAHVSGR